ncbi:MAG: dephospho-CoA kinase [Alphaproteobacteria bacterium]
MIVIGLTGSIGMGKTTTAAMLRRMGVPVCDSDAVVHALLAQSGAAVGPVGRAFEGVVRDGAVDRRALGDQVFGDAAALRRLEAIIHPLVRRAQIRFLKGAAVRHVPLVVLDVPLLYESGTDALCDIAIVVTAPRFLQEQRVLSRPGMTRARLVATLARQMPDGEKRRRADFVVQTGQGHRHTLNRLSGIVRLLRGRRGAHWPPRRGNRGRTHA